MDFEEYAWTAFLAAWLLPIILGISLLLIVTLPIILQIDRLEQSIQQLQLNLASSHQRHKNDTNRLQDQLSNVEVDLRQSQARGLAMEQELRHRDEQLKQNEGEIKMCRDDIVNKTSEVSYLTVDPFTPTYCFSSIQT